MNEKIPDEMDVIVEEEIPQSRVRRVKRRGGKIASDEPILDDLERYRVDQFLVICDTMYQSLCQRFNSVENSELIEEMSYFHPDNFAALAKQKSLHLPFIARVLKIDSTVLVKELKHFANNFVSHSSTTVTMNCIESLDLTEDVGEHADEDEDLYETDEDDNDDGEEETRKSKTQKPCNKCLACCFILLCKLNLHISTYIVRTSIL